MTRANKPVVEAIVNAVARAEGVEPVDLSEPVFAFVDPDALDRLVTSASAQTALSVSFEAWGHEIGITADGAVTVDGEVQDQLAFEVAPRTERGIDG
ncbi:HalOD1 output domain-containing protein [Halorientalis pallida]|uniref:Halobacterial output domain-containing protein n=1 Tax=Halorientalis pallida TaxID=2479928 RepID=A0A498KV71_9EURY|nr:HalOD1 output domain-containing protein [Halorientalis pallida]RXK49077.1 hypothetical protein EAF64_09105 [Halorientalis pallida]